MDISLLLNGPGEDRTAKVSPPPPKRQKLDQFDGSVRVQVLVNDDKACRGSEVKRCAMRSQIICEGIC
jgi:hypothetical protein